MFGKKKDEGLVIDGILIRDVLYTAFIRQCMLKYSGIIVEVFEDKDAFLIHLVMPNAGEVGITLDYELPYNKLHGKDIQNFKTEISNFYQEILDMMAIEEEEQKKFMAEREVEDGQEDD